MKTCYTCNTEKDESFFGKRTASNDGLAHKCKDCQKAYDKKRANLPHRVGARLNYSKTENGKARGSAAKKRWLEKNLVKRSANVIVGNAVRDGRIIKSDSCEACGSNPSKLHGHHDDYAHPLAVRWLCPPCHSKWHKENGEGKNAF